MKIYGYTDEKVCVPVELTCTQIARDGIDPWHLDLFDPNPITLDIDGRWVNFSRLRDVAFAYRQAARQPIVVGLHDGTNGICFTGKEEEVGYHRVHLSAIHQSERSFAQHFETFLKMRYFRSVKVCNGTLIRSAVEGAHAFPPKPAHTVSIQADKVVLTMAPLERGLVASESNPNLRPLTYTGETLTELLDVPTVLAPHVNWVFHTLAAFKPTVTGESLRRSIWKQPVRRVDFFIERRHSRAFDQLMEEELFAPDGSPAKIRLYKEPRGRYFILNGCEYNVALVKPGTTLSRLLLTAGSEFSPLPNMLLDIGNEFSANALFSTDAGTVSGTRLAFFDVASNQARLMHPRSEQDMTDGDRNSRSSLTKSLKSDGVSVLENEFWET